jgi:5-methylcytosine-specific restriction endonuclease McrA
MQEESKAGELLSENGELCSVEGCDRAIMYKTRGICQKHYFRWMRNGSFCLKGARNPRDKRPRKERIIEAARGYVTLFKPAHPLADSSGYVREHRVVYFDEINTAPTECAMCSTSIDWATLHIDHIDSNPGNNVASNLRALCRSCNVFRAHTSTSMGKHFFEIDRVVKTAQGWARTPGVKVAGSTIIRRRMNGSSDFDAVYGGKKTHTSKDARKDKKRYDEIRGVI